MGHEIETFNRFHWSFEWPRFWIIVLASILIALDLIILGMEIGHTVVDLYRSTAFGGFIVFIPLLICSIFIFITAYRPRLILLQIAAFLCVSMIVLCILLIDYDILVLIDPTRCFFFNCNNAQVTLNSTMIVTGWPLNVSLPIYFQNNMNTKRACQSIQLLCAGLFILFSSLFLLTFIIYRNLDLHYRNIYHKNYRTYTFDSSRRT